MNMKLYICRGKMLLFSLLLGGILCTSHSCQYETIPATTKGLIYVR